MTGTTIPWQGEFRAAGRLVRSAEEEIRLEKGELNVGDSDVAADAALDLQHKKPRLTAAIRSRRFDLRPLFATDAFKRLDTGKETDRGSTSKDDQSSREPLLNRIDAELNLASGTILLPQIVIHELDTKARLANGRIGRAERI